MCSTHLHVRVCRCRISVKVYLLDVLAVVSFSRRQSKQTLFQDGVLAVPQSWAQTHAALAVLCVESRIELAKTVL